MPITPIAQPRPRITPSLIGFGACAFDPTSKWHDPDASHLCQTRLIWWSNRPPELRAPFVDHTRLIFGGEALKAGPGWARTDAWVLCARSLPDLINTAEAAADLLAPAPMLPWLPERLRAIAEHWRAIAPPDRASLRDWPMDVNQEAL